MWCLPLYETSHTEYIGQPLMHTVGKAFAATLLALALVGLSTAPSLADREDFVIAFPQPDESTRFLSEFGVAKPDGRTHRGVDLFSDRHTEVVASADGFVETLATTPRAGRYVVLTHADGYETWYLHLGSWADDLEVGDPVAVGQVIGLVGSTGNAAGTSPHTHFELHRKGRAIDPYPYLRAAHERWALSVRIEAGETRFR